VSFILDALRKSDNERQKNAVPSISQIPSAINRTSIPRWTVFLIGVLTICAITLGWGWLKTLSSENVLMTSTDSIKSITVSPANSGVRSLAREARVPADSVPTTIPVSPTQTESPVPLKRTESLQTVFGVVGSPPNIAELVATGSDLPDLRLELHVFSPIPSERFVFINSNRYGEGDTLLEGSRVLTITIEGVILSHGGQNFLLPRN